MVEIEIEEDKPEFEVLPVPPIEQAEPQKPQSEAQVIEDKEAGDEVLKQSLDAGISAILNLTLTTEKNITTEEMSKTQFSGALVKIMDKYFPQMEKDNPALLMLTSTMALAMLINSKGGFKNIGQKIQRTSSRNATTTIESRPNSSEPVNFQAAPQLQPANGATSQNANNANSSPGKGDFSDISRPIV